jgi:hypothetical protein
MVAGTDTRQDTHLRIRIEEPGSSSTRSLRTELGLTDAWARPETVSIA